MIRLADTFEDERTVQTLSGLLSWSHFIEIIYLKDPLQRQFYAEMARVERWSVRTLRKKIQGMLYERTAISRKPEELARQELEALSEEDRMTPDLVFRDLICWTSWGWRTPTASVTWRRPYSGSWRGSCWSWAPTSPSSPARSA